MTALPSTKKLGRRIEEVSAAKIGRTRKVPKWHVCWYVWDDLRVNTFTTEGKKDRFIKIIAAAKGGNKQALATLGLGNKAPSTQGGIGYWKTFRGEMHD